LVATVGKLKTLPLDAVEDINLDDSNTEDLITKFKASIVDSQKTHLKRTMFQHCNAALLSVFWKDFAIITVTATFVELTNIYCAIYIMYLAEYIRDETQHYTRGIWLIAIFLCMNLFVLIFRNKYAQSSLITGIKVRRTLSAVMFDKVIQLSVESLQRTNGAKIITLISADLFAVER
jgi:ABC-type multidrug transport system fused ATPase/permease subunit